MKKLLLLLWLICLPSHAKLYVVVSHESDLVSISVSELSDIYLGRKKTVESVYVNQVLDRTGEVRRRFFEQVTNMQESQVNAYWAKLKFSGRMRAPEAVKRTEVLIKKLIENPNAIGYMSEEPPEGVKVALIIYE